MPSEPTLSRRLMDASKIVAPILATVVLAIIAAFGVWAQQPWLAPSLGSAIFTQVFDPDQPAARPYSIAVGESLGAAAGYAGVFVAGAAIAPAFMSGHELVFARVAAVAIAILLTAVAQLVFKATTPAGGATALVVAVGAESADWEGAFHLAVGILLVTVLGELSRRTIIRVRGIKT